MRPAEKQDIVRWINTFQSKFIQDLGSEVGSMRASMAEIALIYSAMESVEFEMEATEQERDAIKKNMKTFIASFENVVSVLAEYTDNISAYASELPEDSFEYQQARKSDTQVRLAVLRLTDGDCAYCGIKLGSDWHVDHVVPVSKGGPDSFENYVPSCPSCNVSKNGTHVVKFIKRMLEGDSSAQDGATVVKLAGSDQ